MKKTLTIISLCLFALNMVRADTAIFGSHVEIWDGSASTIYKGENFGTNPNFDNTDLGDYELTDTLLIGNSQIDTYKNSGGNVTGGELQYQVYKTTSGPGSFSIHSFAFQANAPFTDIGGNIISGTDDQAWGNTDDIDVLDLASSGNGEYTVEIFFKAFTNEGDKLSNNGGSNFKATFGVIPEPATIGLVAVMGLGTLFIRRVFML